MRNRLVLFGFWLVGTAIAMVMAGLAVQMAGARVTDQPTAVLSPRQIETELGASAAITTIPPSADVPPSAEPAPNDPTISTDSSGQPGGAPTTTVPGPGGPAVTITRPTVPASTTVTTQPDRQGSGHPDPRPDNDDQPPTSAPNTTAPPTSASPSAARQYTLAGGWVRVRCSGDDITMLNAAPNPGYQMDVESTGPQEVRVEFTGAAHGSEFKGRCVNGTAQPELREDENGDDEG